MKLDFKHYPLLLKVVCIVVLLPILAAPLVFYASIFIFDNPSDMTVAYLVFFAVNSYSFVLAGICLTSVWLYSKYRKTHYAVLPFLFMLVVIGAGYWYSVHGPIDKAEVENNDYRLYRDTPCEELASAVYWQNTEKIDRILTQSPELLTYTDSFYHQSVFFYALLDNKMRSVEAMLEHGANPNQIQVDSTVGVPFLIVPLTLVCDGFDEENKKIESARMLLEHGADVNIRFVRPLMKGYDWNSPSTPLMAAAKSGNLNLVRFLLENGADPNYRINELDSPPLQDALIQNHYDIAELLLQHGANPDLRFYERNTSVREELMKDLRKGNDVKEKKRILRLIQALDATRKVERGK